MVKDGFRFAAPPLLLGIIAIVFHWNWIGGILIFLGLFVVFFFRDPERTPPADPTSDRFSRRWTSGGDCGRIVWRQAGSPHQCVSFRL